MDNIMQEVVSKYLGQERKLQEIKKNIFKDCNEKSQKFAEDLRAKGETPNYYNAGNLTSDDFNKMFSDPNSILVFGRK